MQVEGSTRHPFIVFEGECCVGKTSLGRAYAELAGFQYRAVVPDEFRDVVDKVRVSSTPLFPFHFYAFCNQLQSHEYPALLASAGLVADRYVFTTLAFHEVQLKTDLSYFWSALQDDPHFLWPDLIVYVSAAPETIRARMEQRARHRDLRWYAEGVTRKYDLAAAYDRCFERVKIPIVTIDTTDSPLEKSIHTLCAQIKAADLNFTAYPV